MLSDTPNLHAARMLQEEDPSEPSTQPSHSDKWFGSGSQRDPVERRQAALVQVILVGLIVAALLWIPLPLSMSGLMIGRLLGSSGALLVVLFTSIAVIVLRRGHMQRAILLANTGLLIGLALVLVAWA